MSGADRPSVDDLVARHYDDLRRLAHSYLRRERFGRTLQTTALVNEAYVRERASEGHRWRNPVWRHRDGSFAEW